MASQSTRVGKSNWHLCFEIGHKEAHLADIPRRNLVNCISWTFRWFWSQGTVSHNCFCWSALYLRSSLRCVWGRQYLSNKNGKTQLVKQKRSIVRATKFRDDDIHTLDWNSCTRKFTESTKNELQRFVLMQDSLKQLKLDNTSWQNTQTSSYNLPSQWHVVSALCHETTNQLTRKVG